MWSQYKNIFEDLFVQQFPHEGIVKLMWRLIANNEMHEFVLNDFEKKKFRMGFAPALAAVVEPRRLVGAIGG